MMTCFTEEKLTRIVAGITALVMFAAFENATAFESDTNASAGFRVSASADSSHADDEEVRNDAQAAIDESVSSTTDTASDAATEVEDAAAQAADEASAAVSSNVASSISAEVQDDVRAAITKDISLDLTRELSLPGLD